MPDSNNETNGSNIIIVYRTYQPSQKKASKKYYDANKTKVLERHMDRYYSIKSDPEKYEILRERNRLLAKKYRERKKLEKQKDPTTTEPTIPEPLTPEPVLSTY